MDQFEEIRKKNKRIIKVLLGVPFLLFFIVLGLSVLYFLPLYTKAREVARLEVQIMQDQDITQEEADSYIKGLTGDEQIRDILADNSMYNSSLLSLYLKKSDYDKTIEYALSVIGRVDQPIYHYYLGFAYFEKGRFDEATAEMMIVSSATIEAIAGDLDSENGIRSAADIKEAAQAMVDIIEFRKFIAEEYGPGDMEEVGAYITRFEKNDDIMELELTDKNFNFLYFEYYLSAMNFDKILAQAPKVIAARDSAIYHYYLGVAYNKTGKQDLALQEMKSFLEGENDDGPYFSFARKRELARVFMSKDYYARGNYAKSAEIMKGAFLSVDMTDSIFGAGSEPMREFASIVVNKSEYETTPVSDGDGDGLSDDLENILGTDPKNRDTDGDGYIDEKELLFGHSPLRQSSSDDKMTDKDYCDFYDKILSHYPSIYSQL